MTDSTAQSSDRGTVWSPGHLATRYSKEELKLGRQVIDQVLQLSNGVTLELILLLLKVQEHGVKLIKT